MSHDPMIKRIKDLIESVSQGDTRQLTEWNDTAPAVEEGAEIPHPATPADRR